MTDQMELLSLSEIVDVDKNLVSNLVEMISKKFAEKDIFDDGKRIETKYKDTEYLKSFDSKTYLLQRNQVLLSLINGCCDTKYQNQKDASLLDVIAVAVEIIYCIRNLNLVLPHCFLMNHLENFVSGSKIVSVLNGKWILYPKKMATYQGKNELKWPFNDVITFFENIGK